MFVRACVCARVCACVGVYFHVLHVCVSVCIYISMHVYAGVCMCVHVYTCMRLGSARGVCMGRVQRRQ